MISTPVSPAPKRRMQPAAVQSYGALLGVCAEPILEQLLVEWAQRQSKGADDD